MSWEIRQGHVLDCLREMPDESVHCVVTSPPYWALRDYGVDGQLGLEETPEQFVASMVEVFAEVRRVLRPDGTLWLNLGDSYASNTSANKEGASKTKGGVPGHVPNAWGARTKSPVKRPDRLKPKDLVGVPWMLAFALRTDGWYLRRDIIWAKPNPMPESVTDRPTSAHEYLFLLTKSARYFYDAEAIREPATYAGPNGAQRSPYGQGFTRRDRDQERERQDKQRGHGRRHDGFNDRWDAMSKEEQSALGRNKRSVWDIPEEAWVQFQRWLAEQPKEKLSVWRIATKPFSAAHFATFPPELVEPCIKVGTSPKVCGECGAPWWRRTEVTYENPGNRTTNGPRSLEQRHETAGFARRLEKSVETTGWEPTCDHADDSGRAVVLDPFAGAATTLLVAEQLRRDSIGIELNPEYVALGEDRIRRWEHDPAGHLRREEPIDGQGSIFDLQTPEQVGEGVA